MEMRLKKKKREGREIRGDIDIYFPFLSSIDIPTQAS